MWSREALKMDAKATMKNCFGNSILVCLILSFATGTANGISSRVSNNNNIDISHISLAQLSLWFGAFCVAAIITYAVQIFALNLLVVGSSHFFLSARVTPTPDINSVGFAFGNRRYGNVCKTMFLMRLFIYLWSLLFVIPGIYKSYQWRMVPYLLAENPEMDYKRALSLSAAMMDGEKMDAFVLDLSFIGWYFLSIFTCGILAIAYVEPYQEHTNAGLYIALREKAINNGLVHPSELYAVINNVPQQ